MHFFDRTDQRCLLAAAAAVLLTLLLIFGCLQADAGVQTEKTADGISDAYADTLFDSSYVHVIDNQLPQVNWDYMVRNAEQEQYVWCNVVIDGELFTEAAIRPKGNSSLSAIAFQESDRFSFKIEFDHYHAGSTFRGLDKLALNNLGQDVSCLKDYLVYHMMNEAGVAAPLSSFARVQLNGEDFGLYLAVEAVEDSFARRCYGADSGSLYKPDCFAVSDLSAIADAGEAAIPQIPDYSQAGPGDRVDLLGSVVRTPFEAAFGDQMAAAALQYMGEDREAYSVILDSAVFETTGKDADSLIAAVRTLRDDPAAAIDAESLIRYFVVHNFVNNYDGYTGVFTHNFYLREYEGRFSLIPWDYNLAFGVFTLETAGRSILGLDSGYEMGRLVENAMDDKTGMVNYPIDTPTITVATEDRPLLAAVLEDPALLARYHEFFGEFLNFFDSGGFEELFCEARDNIAPYVEQGLTFYSYDRFLRGAEAVHDYCLLRTESIHRQLDGTLPATMEGQSADYADLVDASGLDLAASVTFDGMLFGIQSADVTAMLDAAAGDHDHSWEGLTEAAAEMTEDNGALLTAVGRIVNSSRVVRKLLTKALAVPLLLILSFAVLLIARRRMKTARRRRR